MPFGQPVLSPLHSSQEVNSEAGTSANACINLDTAFEAVVAPNDGSAIVANTDAALAGGIAQEAATSRAGGKDNAENPCEQAVAATNATDAGKATFEKPAVSAIQSDEAVMAAIAKNLYGSGAAVKASDSVNHLAGPSREVTEEDRIGMVEKACKNAAFGASSEEEIVPAVAAVCVESLNTGISRTKLAAIAARVVSQIFAKTNEAVDEIAAAAGDAARRTGEALAMTAQQAEIAATAAEKQIYWKEADSRAEQGDEGQEDDQGNGVHEDAR